MDFYHPIPLNTPTYDNISVAFNDGSDLYGVRASDAFGGDVNFAPSDNSLNLYGDNNFMSSQNYTGGFGADNTFPQNSSNFYGNGDFMTSPNATLVYGDDMYSQNFIPHSTLVPSVQSGTSGSYGTSAFGGNDLQQTWNYQPFIFNGYDANFGMDTMKFISPPSPMYYTSPPSPVYYVNDSMNTTFVDVLKDDDRNSMANASTCDSTPIMMPNVYEPVINDGFELNYRYNNNICNIEQDTSSEESIIEISNEIANNMQFLPDKDGNGKYSLDKNHPIHCVWRDINRGHCSWRCRWWYNGKRLSKNFNVKRFGDFEAMRMAITMKIRNSTPVERLQLLKEQREAVRNHLELLKSHNNITVPKPIFTEPQFEQSKKIINNTKRLQQENWNRISWTYIKSNDNHNESSIICKLCAKTTRCSRSRNLQQAHIMHLIRMHKNPWKQYLHVGGLTKMCKSAIDALYQQYNFGPNHKWHLRPGIERPEPTFN